MRTRRPPQSTGTVIVLAAVLLPYPLLASDMSGVGVMVVMLPVCLWISLVALMALVMLALKAFRNAGWLVFILVCSGIGLLGELFALLVTVGGQSMESSLFTMCLLMHFLFGTGFLVATLLPYAQWHESKQPDGWRNRGHGGTLGPH